MLYIQQLENATLSAAVGKWLVRKIAKGLARSGLGEGFVGILNLRSRNELLSAPHW